MASGWIFQPEADFQSLKSQTSPCDSSLGIRSRTLRAVPLGPRNPFGVLPGRLEASMGSTWGIFAETDWEDDFVGTTWSSFMSLCCALKPNHQVLSAYSHIR